jgi:hypothetical protein
MIPLLALLAPALADDAAITVPLPALIGEITELTAWEAADEEASPPLSWTRIGTHRTGDEHLLYDADGRLALRCEIRAFELSETEQGEEEVRALLDCGQDAVAAR